VSFGEIVAFAFGVMFAGVGLFALGKFGHQALYPPDEDHRRARAPFLLIVGRRLGVGAAFIVFGLTRSWIALACGVALLMSEALIGWWTRRRLGDLIS
jgi:hypothetical protein